MMKKNFSRRQFLGSFGALGLGTFLAGCPNTRKPLPPCSDLEPEVLVPARAKRLTAQPFAGIDMHCHIFNAHDVPLSEFLTGPVLHFKPPFDDLLRLITEPVEAGFRWYALSAADEYEKLCELVSNQRAKALGKAFSIEDAVRDEIEADDQRFEEFMADVANKDSQFRKLYRSLERDELKRLGVPPDALPKQEAPLTPQEIGRALQYEPRSQGLKRYTTTGTEATRIWPFLRRFWARRYHNAYRLLDLYGVGTDGPQIDVFFAAAVDFDVPLDASPASSRLEDQLKLMVGISVVTGGRVLPFVPFDPRRDVESSGEAFEIVEKGVMKYGCVGVKLYPPMGFKASGNEGPDPGCNWPSDDYGEKLDQSLNQLYTWCQEHEVPILAHSSESNGVSKKCQRLGGPDDWRDALKDHPELQVCVGHFGGDNERAAEADYSRTRGFAKLMQESYATNFYADVSYMPGLFEPGSKLSQVVAELQSTPLPGNPNASVADRLLYGSDWFMVTLEPAEKQYVREMARYFRELGGDLLVTKVFSTNSVTLFQLATRPDGSISKLRERLNTFFDSHDLSPQWLRKIDSVNQP